MNLSFIKENNKVVINLFIFQLQIYKPNDNIKEWMSGSSMTRHLRINVYPGCIYFIGQNKGVGFHWKGVR